MVAVFGFAGAVGCDCAPACAMAHFHGFDGFGQGADLVDFDEQGIGGFL